jgi:hypothetical protein|nr:MAG TPA: hypothetical protein [Caudoviricetes sp.]
MENSIKKIGIFPVTKQSQQELANSLIIPVLDGEVNPIEHVAKMRGLYDALKKVLDDDRIKDSVITETEKYGKSASWNGCEITLKEIGSSYDYSVCNDPVYNAYLVRLKELQADMKDREAFLKSVPDNTTIVDDSTGEIVTLHPAVKMARQGYTIKFK